MVQRAPLEVVLARAEAAFARAAIGTADVEANWSKTNLRLDYARFYCRKLRAALGELDLSESIANINEARSHCRELRTFFLEINSSAKKMPFRCLEPSCSLLDSPRTTCWVDCLEQSVAEIDQFDTSSNCPPGLLPPSPDQAAPGFGAGFPAQDRSSKTARARASRLWRSAGLLLLVLAFLAYFVFDA